LSHPVNPETSFSQRATAHLWVEKLPDGSMAILDEHSRDMHSLNPSAAAVWEACGNGATLAQVTSAVEQKFGGIGDEAVTDGLGQLQRAKLVEAAGAASATMTDPGRRSMLKRLATAGAVAIPVVLTLTASGVRHLD
jgi:hypothetical protein